MTARILSAGDTIEAHCTRCRTLLNHTIVAMVGERVVRVECNTCRGMHNYIRGQKTASPAPAAAIRKSASASSKSKKEPGAAEREEWDALIAGMAGQQAIPYDMNGRFRVNDLVEHTIFGLGIVQTVVGVNKMQVFFRCGKKLLRCQ